MLYAITCWLYSCRWNQRWANRSIIIVMSLVVGRRKLAMLYTYLLLMSYIRAFMTFEGSTSLRVFISIYMYIFAYSCYVIWKYILRVYHLYIQFIPSGQPTAAYILLPSHAERYSRSAYLIWLGARYGGIEAISGWGRPDTSPAAEAGSAPDWYPSVNQNTAPPWPGKLTYLTRFRIGRVSSAQ